MRRISMALLVAAAGTLACARELPPRGEALIVVDTDLPVPRFASRLRVDVYVGGRWIESRDVARPSAVDWPTSFSVYAPDDVERVAVVRLRAYREGGVRDYQGERFVGLPDPSLPLSTVLVPERTFEPRLMAGDRDVTPLEEPLPWLTIDRLILVRVVPGVVGRVQVTLHGACVGTMADIVSGTTCVDRDRERVALTEMPLESTMTTPSKSVSGTFPAAARCTAEPRKATMVDGVSLHDDEVCIDGGAFVFGTPVDVAHTRFAVVSPFLIDRYEVTVGRMRAALSRGFGTRIGIVANEGEIGATSTPEVERWCTYTMMPGDREEYPVTCVAWSTARAFCNFEGGDLATSVQWEYAAAAAGRDRETPYPWGDVVEGCARAVYGRYNDLRDLGGYACADYGGIGARDVRQATGAGGDTTPLGVHGFGGSASEWTVDSPYSLYSACWLATGVRDPVCLDPKCADHAVRGGAWMFASTSVSAHAATQGDQFLRHPAVGFRCVRKGVRP